MAEHFHDTILSYYHHTYIIAQIERNVNRFLNVCARCCISTAQTVQGAVFCVGKPAPRKSSDWVRGRECLHYLFHSPIDSRHLHARHTAGEAGRAHEGHSLPRIQRTMRVPTVNGLLRHKPCRGYALKPERLDGICSTWNTGAPDEQRALI